MQKICLIILSLCIMPFAWAECDYNILYDWHNYYSMREGDLYTIAVDEKYIYLGTTYGLITIDKVTDIQSHLDRTDGLTDNYISCLNLIGDELWYGGHTNGFGMIKDNRVFNITRSMSPIASTAWISVLKKDKEGNLWVASLGCLYKFVNGECVESYSFPDLYITNFRTINDIFIEENTVWVSGYSTPGMKGLGKLTPKGIEMVYEDLGTGANIIKDKQGNKWMAAEKGLLRFNNDSFKEYRTDAKGNNLGRMVCLTEDRAGNLWAVRDSFLIKYDGKEITSYNAHSRLQYMVLHNDVFYITAGHHGVLKFKDDKFQLITLQKYAGQLPFKMAMTRAGSIDHDGNYLAGTSGGTGLLKMKDDGSYTVTDFFKDKYISKTVSDRNRDIWVACNRTSPFRLFKITPTDTIAYNLDGSSPLKGGEDIFQMAVDQHNRLWIASSNGLHCFDGNNWQTYDKDNSGLTTNRVYCIAFDKNGHLWTCCGKNLTDYLELGDGLFCYDGKVWTHYISSHDVRRATEGWVGPTIPIPTNSIGLIAFDDNNTFWIACNVNEVYSTADIDDWHGGLICWDGKDHWQRFMSRNAETPDSIASDLPGNWVNSIEFDRYGRVWLGFEGDHGIAMYDGKEFTIWDMDVPGIASGEICNLCVDRERNHIWVSHPIGNGASFAKIRGSETDGIKPLLSPSNTRPRNSDRIFDIGGRQISQPKHGEPFIKNGRKYIKR